MKIADIVLTWDSDPTGYSVNISIICARNDLTKTIVRTKIRRLDEILNI